MRFSCSSVLGHLKNQKIAEGSDASSFFYWLTSSCLFHNIATSHSHLWRSNKLFLYNLITSAPDSVENHRGYCSTLLARPSNAYSESVDDATPSKCFVFPTSIFTAPNAWTTYMRIRCLDTHDLAQLTYSPYEACWMMQIQQPPLLACQWVTFSAERASWVAHFFLNDAILKILSYWPRIFAGTPVLNMARGIYTYAHIMKYTIKYVDSLQIRHCLCRLGHLHRVLARRADVETVESLPWLFPK